MVGTISLVYNQLRNNCGFHIAEIQKKYPENIVTSLHLQLPNQDTFENILVRGNSQKLKNISDELITCKGVKVGQLNLSANVVKESLISRTEETTINSIVQNNRGPTF